MERKTIEDAPLSEKTLDDMIHDNYSKDEYRTDSTKGFNLFEFKTETESLVNWKVKEFSSWFKDPTGWSIAEKKQIIPYMNHKVTPNAPEKVDHDMFGNYIMKNQKDIPVDYMNRELPEKFAYGLDKKGMGDIAYEALDIEYGDENGLSRARANFYEEIYLKQNHPQVANTSTLNELDTAKSNITKQINKNTVSSKVQKQSDDGNSSIVVEGIPSLLKETETISNESSGKLYRSLMDKENKPLTVPEVKRINAILTSLNAKKIPYNTLAHNGAEKLKQAYMKLEKENKSTYLDEESEEEETGRHVERTKKREERRQTRSTQRRGLKTLKQFADEKGRQRDDKSTAILHRNTGLANLSLDALEMNRDQRQAKRAQKALNEPPTMVDQNLMEEPIINENNEQLKNMANKKQRKSMIEDVKQLAKQVADVKNKKAQKIQGVVRQHQARKKANTDNPMTAESLMEDHINEGKEQLKNMANKKQRKSMIEDLKQVAKQVRDEKNKRAQKIQGVVRQRQARKKVETLKQEAEENKQTRKDADEVGSASAYFDEEAEKNKKLKNAFKELRYHKDKNQYKRARKIAGLLPDSSSAKPVDDSWIEQMIEGEGPHLESLSKAVKTPKLASDYKPPARASVETLVKEFIALKDTDPAQAETKRKQLRDEFDDEDINKIVNKTPGKTNKEKKVLKSLIHSNEPIEPPALPPPSHMPGKSSPPSTPRKDGDELRPTDPTPAFPPLTVEKLNEMVTEYQPNEKMSEKHRKTLNLYGIKVDGRRNVSAMDLLNDITEEIIKKGGQLLADTKSKPFSDKAGKTDAERPTEKIEPPKAPKKSGGGGPKLTNKVSMARGAGWKR
jgi:hypothetical protein